MLNDLKPYPFFQDSNGLLYHFDIERSKWLSVNRETMSFNITSKKVSKERYMAYTGNFYSNVSGKKMIRNATITAISVQTDNVQCSFDLNIHKNNNPNKIYTITLLNEPSKIFDNINFDLFKGDFIQVSITPAANNTIKYPEMIIEYSWKTQN